MSYLILKQFRAEGSLAYIIADPAARHAALIDPCLESVSDYRQYLMDRGLSLKWLVDTHTHADHFSAASALGREFNAPIVMSEATRCRRVDRLAKDGERFRLGEFELEVWLTPGHTPDSLCIRGPGLVFTGDTLLIGSTGRTDFEEADPAAQWDSLERLITKLPDDAVVLPGHDYQQLICSTIGAEREKNPHLQMSTREAFVQMKKAEALNTMSDEVARRIAFNLDPEAHGPVPARSGGPAAQCGQSTGMQEQVTGISVEKYRSKVENPQDGVLRIDVREPEEYAEGHIPGTENIPLSEIGLHWSRLLEARRIYLSCLSGRRSAMAARTLSYLGHPDAVNVTGGFQAWVQGELPTTK